MRKYIALVLAFVCVLGLIGCTQNETAQNSEYKYPLKVEENDEFRYPIQFEPNGEESEYKYPLGYEDEFRYPIKFEPNEPTE